MDTVLLVATVLALLMAWSARKKVAALEDRVGDARRSASTAQADAEELKGKVDILRALLGRVAGGHDVDALMVREGRLYRNVSAAQLQKVVEAGGAYVVDVRSDQEWATGHIPGAVHIPIDGLDKQMHAVKRDGTAMYLVCAGGGRSSAAATLLSERGYLNVFNVEGGMNSWRGPVTNG